MMIRGEDCLIPETLRESLTALVAMWRKHPSGSGMMHAETACEALDAIMAETADLAAAQVAIIAAVGECVEVMENNFTFEDAGLPECVRAIGRAWDAYDRYRCTH